MVSNLGEVLRIIIVKKFLECLVILTGIHKRTFFCNAMELFGTFY